VREAASVKHNKQFTISLKKQFTVFFGVFNRTVDEAGHDDYASNKLDWTIDGDHSVKINR
jgi:hypothetical protein